MITDIDAALHAGELTHIAMTRGPIHSGHLAPATKADHKPPEQTFVFFNEGWRYSFFSVVMEIAYCAGTSPNRAVEIAVDLNRAAYAALDDLRRFKRGGQRSGR